jgi:hypothetical protein
MRRLIAVGVRVRYAVGGGGGFGGPGAAASVALAAAWAPIQLIQSPHRRGRGASAEFPGRAHWSFSPASIGNLPSFHGIPLPINRPGNLVRTRRAPPIPRLCFDQGYWAGVINFQLLAAHGMISPIDLEIICFADDVEEAWKALVGRIL